MGFLPYRTPPIGFLPWNYILPTGIPSDQDSSQPGSLPTGIPPDRDSSQIGLLPEISSRNGIPPETGFLPKQDSSQNGIPPKTGCLLKQVSSQNCRKLFFGRHPVSGGIPFWEESRFGRNQALGGIPFWEEFHGRDPVWEEFLGRDPGGRSFLGGIPLGRSSKATNFII